jgi:hypothetical protein
LNGGSNPDPAFLLKRLVLQHPFVVSLERLLLSVATTFLVVVLLSIAGRQPLSLQLSKVFQAGLSRGAILRTLVGRQSRAVALDRLLSFSRVRRGAENVLHHEHFRMARIRVEVPKRYGAHLHPQKGR